MDDVGIDHSGGRGGPELDLWEKQLDHQRAGQQGARGVDEHVADEIQSEH